MGLREGGWRVQFGSCKHGNKPSGSINGGQFSWLVERTVRFSRTLMHEISQNMEAGSEQANGQKYKHYFQLP